MQASDFLSRNKSNLVFFILLIAMFFIYRYPYSIRKGPYSIHYWRQANGYSIALNYEKENIGFFEPTIHWTGDSGSGKSVGEFPLIYFIVGKIWKLVGHHEFIFRLFNLLIFYTGLYYLFRFLKEFLQEDFWAIMVPLFLFTSPVLVYYGNTSLMNVPAFGLVLIGAFYYWRFLRTHKMLTLCISMSIFTLAGLLKSTSLLLFTAFLIILILSFSGKLQKSFNFTCRFRPVHLVPFALVILVNLGWFLWVRDYDGKHISGIFLQGLIPVWHTKLYDGLYIGTLFYTELLGKLFNIPAFYCCLLMLIWLVYKIRETDPFLMSLTILTLGGSILYILLFFQAMHVHDYYLVNLAVVIPLIFVTFLDYLRKNHPDLFRDRALKGTAIAGLILMVYGTMVVERARYDLHDTFVKHTIILNLKEKDLYQLYQDDYRNHFEALETIQPYLRQLDIQREDKVLSIPDMSPNFTLYLMDQKGITDYGYSSLDEADKIEHFISTGGKYLIVNDSSILARGPLQPYIRNKIGRYGNVSIFKLESMRDKKD